MTKEQLAKYLQPGRTELLEGVLYLDASSLTAWQKCRRLWYMGSWLSWEPSERPLDARDKGSAWGRALDLIWLSPSPSQEEIKSALGPDHESLVQSVLEYQSATREWRESFVQVEAEHFILLPLTSTISLFGWVDKVAIDRQGKVWMPEHKTGGEKSPPSLIFQQHRHTLQIGLYTLYGVRTFGERFGGVVVDAAQLSLKGNTFAHRVVDIFPEHLQMVESELCYLAEEVARGLHFPQVLHRNTTSCYDFFRECVFAAGCHYCADLRTLQLPGGMRVRPRDQMEEEDELGGTGAERS